jgi:hypothetical protein
MNQRSIGNQKGDRPSPHPKLNSEAESGLQKPPRVSLGTMRLWKASQTEGKKFLRLRD